MRGDHISFPKLKSLNAHGFLCSRRDSFAEATTLFAHTTRHVLHHIGNGRGPALWRHLKGRSELRMAHSLIPPEADRRGGRGGFRKHLVFSDAALLQDVFQHIAASHELQHDGQVVLSQEHLLEPHNVGMKQAGLVHHLPLHVLGDLQHKVRQSVHRRQ